MHGGLLNIFCNNLKRNKRFLCVEINWFHFKQQRCGWSLFHFDMCPGWKQVSCGCSFLILVRFAHKTAVSFYHTLLSCPIVKNTQCWLIVQGILTTVHFSNFSERWWLLLGVALISLITPFDAINKVLFRVARLLWRATRWEESSGVKVRETDQCGLQKARRVEKTLALFLHVQQNHPDNL